MTLNLNDIPASFPRRSCPRLPTTLWRLPLKGIHDSSIIFSLPFCFLKHVAVGTPVTRRPPHRSVREGLPHTALTSDA